eukprot:272479_1
MVMNFSISLISNNINTFALFLIKLIHSRDWCKLLFYMDLIQNIICDGCKCSDIIWGIKPSHTQPIKPSHTQPIKLSHTPLHGPPHRIKLNENKTNNKLYI